MIYNTDSAYGPHFFFLIENWRKRAIRPKYDFWTLKKKKMIAQLQKIFCKIPMNTSATIYVMLLC